MFQKLVREHSALQEHWNTLLEKGSIENVKGSITLLRKYAAEERVVLIKDAQCGILYTVRASKLEVVRGIDSRKPVSYVFQVGAMDKLDLENLIAAYEEYEGFETSIRDLLKALERIITEHKRSLGAFYRVKDWFRSRLNCIFFAIFAVYALITAVVSIQPLI